VIYQSRAGEAQKMGNMFFLNRVEHKFRPHLRVYPIFQVKLFRVETTRYAKAFVLIHLSPTFLPNIPGLSNFSDYCNTFYIKNKVHMQT